MKAPIGWHLGQGTGFSDITSQFHAISEKIRGDSSTLPKDAKSYLYLMVPGLFTERYPGYMKENVSRLQSLGLLTRVSGIDSDASVLSNAAIIKNEVLASHAEGRRVVIFGHSKGGVDASAALALYPEIRPHVRVLVAMQAPYGGTPIATDLFGNATLRKLVSDFIKRIFRGDPNALADLSYEVRQKFLAEHPHPGEVPTLCLATNSHSPLSLTVESQLYISKRYGEKSDGLVAQKDAIIPGSRVVLLDDLNHAAPAMFEPKWATKHRPGDITHALAVLALS